MKPEFILNLEKELNTTFIEVDVKKIKKFHLNKNYVLDKNNNIIGLSIIGFNLNSNQITDISNSVDLKNLIYLNLSNNQITDISDLKNLKNLTDLYLNNNQITDISNLGDLKNLAQLSLINNQITDIPNLKNPIYLNLSNNQITDIPNLKNPIHFNLSNNQITNITNLTDLKNLIYLNLSSNQITDISNLKNLKNLTDLYLSNNQITNISNLADLKSLTFLHLGSNQITDISNLMNLKNLTHLSLNGNQITDILNLMDLKNLTSIDLKSNQLKKLPIEICNIKSSIVWSEAFSLDFNLYDNPLIEPPITIVKQGKYQIKKWFEQRKYGKAKVYEAKLLVVGEPKAGKTTLVKKIFDDNHQIPSKNEEDSTLGIEVQSTNKFSYTNDSKITITTNIWDFGGQDIQYALHQYFLSDEALYILVSDYRSENTRFNYWFQSINLLTSRQSRVIVLLNKFKDTTSVSNFDINSYKRDFPDLNIEVVELDLSEKGNQWSVFKDKIAIKLSELPVVGQEGIKVWKSIREKIAELKTENYINLNAFYTIAKKEGIENEEDIQFMLDYFHKIGVVVYFEDDNLASSVFLDPNWITRAIYAALSDENFNHKYGHFEKKWIFDFWKKNGYNKPECLKLLNLMQKDKFDICYCLDSDKNNYIVPLLLPEKIPNYNWKTSKNLHFRYVYEQFMPEGVISQLIVKLNKHIATKDDKQLVWKKGVILNYNLTKAEIIEPTNGREIHIKLQGENKIELRGIIKNNIESIFNRYPKQPEIKIPCNCTQCERLETPHFFNYSDILKRKSNNIPNAGECENSYQSIKIVDLIEELQAPIKKREKIVSNYFTNGKVKRLIKKFHEIYTNILAARFFKNVNESTYHVLLFDWLNEFKPENSKVSMEANCCNGEIDLLVEIYSNSNNKINDIFEFKYIPKSSTDAKMKKDLNDAFEQVKSYQKCTEYNNYRIITVVFRGNKDYKIKIV